MARARRSGFQGDVTWNRKRYRADGFKTLLAAEIWEAQCLANVKAGHAPPPAPAHEEDAGWTVAAMLDWAYAEYWATKGDPSYFLKQIAVLKKDLGPDYPAIDLAGAAGYARIKAAGEARGNSGETINKKASIISKAIKLSIERGKMVGVLKPQFARLPSGAGRERVMTRDEETTCLAWLRQCDPEMADWFVLAIDTGFRSYSEGLHIYPYQDVRGADLFIRGRLIAPATGPNVIDFASASRRTKTGVGKSRVVGLTKRALAIVEEHKRRLGNRTDARLFEDLSKQRIIDRWRMMKDKLKIIDADLVPYSLRHTFGTRMILAGETVPNLSVLMGHSTLKQTWKYVHLAGLVQTGAVSKLEKYLEG